MTFDGGRIVAASSSCPSLRDQEFETHSYERARKRGPLTVFLLAYNLFADSFFEASCPLDGKSASRCL